MFPVIDDQTILQECLKLVVADDHAGFRDELVGWVHAHRRLVVAGEAADGLEAWDLIQEHLPDVALLDLMMPKLDGIDGTRRICGSGLNVAVIIVTLAKDESVFNDALDSGVMGYLVKDDLALDLHDAIIAVAGGQRFVSRSVAVLMDNREMRLQRRSATTTGIGALTPTELRLLQLLAEKWSVARIGKQLRSPKETVEAQSDHLRDKLNLVSHGGLVSFGEEHLDQLRALKLFPVD